MYIFFIRQFADLDHATPIIYKMAQKGSTAIRVLCQNLDYDIRTDFIIKYLREELGIKTDYSYSLYANGVLKRILAAFVLWIRRIFPKIGAKLFKKLQHRLYDEKWAEYLLTHLKASALILDFQKDSKFSTRVLTEAARRLQVPVIAITHGVTMRVSDIEEKSYLFTADLKICANHHQVEFYKTQNDTENDIKVAGSTRYCDEWERIYNTILSNTFECHDLPNDNGKLKVLFFERPKIGFYGDHDIVQAVGKLDFVNVVHKGKPKIKFASSRVAGSSYPSARLVQWADVVVMSTSSIALEVLWQGKPLIYLKYLSPHDLCVFEQYQACWIVNSQRELTDALKKIHLNSAYRPYRQENVNRLLEDAVYAGDKTRDILSDYAELIINFKKSKPVGDQLT
ncbi:MAG: hypothetical protein PVG96_08600 [Desulfobacterales bacterium]